MNIKLHEPTFGEDEIAAAVEVLRSTNVTAGEKVRELEQAFAGPGAYGVMVNSGSSANLLAIAALVSMGVAKPGDEVIVPALCWSTTVAPLLQHGLVPVIVDIDPETLNIDRKEVVKAESERTAFVMPVHVYGNPCNLIGLDIGMIEDCCEALGAAPIGNGIANTYSFYFSHHITTLEGGIVVTRDEALADHMRIIRSHGWVRDCDYPSRWAANYPDFDPRFLFVEAGYNLRPTELAAAIGLVQLPKLKGFVEARRRVAKRLTEGLAPFADLIRTQKETLGGMSSWFGMPVVLTEEMPLSVRDIRRYLADNGIETRPIICGNIARQPMMAKYPHRVVGDLKHADAVMARGFSLPCHQNVTDEQATHMLDALAMLVGGDRKVA